MALCLDSLKHDDSMTIGSSYVMDKFENIIRPALLKERIIGIVPLKLEEPISFWIASISSEPLIRKLFTESSGISSS